MLSFKKKNQREDINVGAFSDVDMRVSSSKIKNLVLSQHKLFLLTYILTFFRPNHLLRLFLPSISNLKLSHYIYTEFYVKPDNEILSDK